MDNFNYEKELSKCKTLEDITGKNGLVQRIVKDAIEKILQEEFNQHIEKTESYRNGYSNKKVKTEYGDIDIKVPRDRDSQFQPELLNKRQTTTNNIKEQITSMYAKGMSTRDISDHIETLYGTTLSSNTISTITDEALLKSIYLTLNDITKKWTSPYSNWGQTLAQFKISFEDRIQLEI